MPERSLEAFDFKGPRPQTILILIVLLILFIVSWGSFANIRFSAEYEGAIEAKQVAQQQVETQKQVLAQREIEAQ